MKSKRIPTDSPFGMTLRKLRKVAGLTQEELAERGGLSTRGLSDLERGVIQFPHRDTVLALVRALALGQEEEAELKAAARPRLRSGAGTESGEPAASVALVQALPVGGFLGSLPATPVVARETELGTLDRLLDAVAEGDGQFVLLAGEAGVGKTRLAQEVTLAAHRRGMLVVSGRCYEPQEAVAYYPFLDALSIAFEASAAPLGERAAQHWPQLVRLLPISTERGVEPPEETTHLVSSTRSDEQQRLFWQVADFFQSLAQMWPVAILLDDLQWADQASLDLLLHLARHTRTSRILLLGTYRSDELARGSSLRAALHDLSREGLATTVYVRRLSPEGTRALLATLDLPAISDEFVQALHARAEGNAFFTRQLVRSLLERDADSGPRENWDRTMIEEVDLPESVRAVIGQRLTHLSSDAQQMLYDASVLGQTFAFDDLLAMSDREEALVEAAVEEAREAGLVREAMHDRFGFSHALIQQALYRALPSRKRQRLHRAAGAAIEHASAGATERERQRRAAELAYHFLAANEFGRALPYTLQAGDRAESVYAHTEAERHYRSAVEAAGRLDDNQSEANALEKQGQVLWMLGREREALEVLERAAQRYEALGNLEGQLRVIACMLPIHGSQGTPDEGVARAGPLIAAAEACEGLEVTRGLSALYSGLAALYAKCGRFQEQLTAATRAEELARALSDDTLLVSALQWRALATANLGMENPLPLFLALATLAERIADKWTLSRALNNVATTLEYNGELTAALPYLDRALDVAEQLGSPPEIALRLLNRAASSYLIGAWHSARDDCMRAAAIIEHVDLGSATWLATYPYLWLGALDVAENHSKTGNERLERALALAQRIGDLVAQRYIAWILCERDLLEGRAAIAYERLQPLLDRPGHQEADVERLLPLAAWAEVELGMDDRAAATIETAFARCSPIWRIDALRSQAMLQARKQRYDEATQTLDEALRQSQGIGCPYAEAKVLYAYGIVQAAKGELEDGRTRHGAALAICERLGEGLYLRRIENALQELEPSFVPRRARITGAPSRSSPRTDR